MFWMRDAAHRLQAVSYINPFFLVTSFGQQTIRLAGKFFVITSIVRDSRAKTEPAGSIDSVRRAVLPVEPTEKTAAAMVDFSSVGV
jgi:hypothetical protein